MPSPTELFELAAALVAYPLAGCFALGIANVVWQTANAAPPVQRYFWFMLSGYVLVNLGKFAGAFVGSGANW